MRLYKPKQQQQQQAKSSGESKSGKSIQSQGSSSSSSSNNNGGLTSPKNNNNTKKKSSAPSKRKVCGCMATRHAFSCSCIHCGRILCTEEKPTVEDGVVDNCPFCQAILVLPISATDVEEARGIGETKLTDLDLSNAIKSYKLKDKLLLFDKENAKRTQVHDAQADYYETSTWLSPEEKKEMEIKEQLRKQAVSQIKTSVLSSGATSTFSLNLQEGSISEEMIQQLTIDDEAATTTATSSNNAFAFASPFIESSTISCKVDFNNNNNNNNNGIMMNDVSLENEKEIKSIPINLQHQGLLNNTGKLGDIYRAVMSSTKKETNNNNNNNNMNWKVIAKPSIVQHDNLDFFDS